MYAQVDDEGQESEQVVSHLVARAVSGVFATICLADVVGFRFASVELRLFCACHLHFAVYRLLFDFHLTFDNEGVLK